MGGLSRKYNTILTISEQRNMPYLLLDAGNALFDSEINRVDESRDSITARGIADIYTKMQYNAVNVGPNDIAAGIPFLLELDKVPWISANYFNPSGEPVFQQYIIRKLKGLSIAVIGMTPAPENLADNYHYQAWTDILPQLVTRLREETDFIILLSALSQQENETIARRFPQVRIILSSLISRRNTYPRPINNAIIAQTAYQGKYLGHLAVSNGTGSRWQYQDEESQKRLKQRIKALDYRISRLEKTSSQPKQKPSTIKILSAERQKLEEQLKKQLSFQESSSPSFYSAEFTALTSNLPEEEGSRAIVDAIKRARQVFINEKRQENRRRYQKQRQQKISAENHGDKNAP